jgi:hypothetical protein
MDPGPLACVLAALSRAEVRYLVVGGVACVEALRRLRERG